MPPTMYHTLRKLASNLNSDPPQGMDSTQSLRLKEESLDTISLSFLRISSNLYRPTSLIFTKNPRDEDFDWGRLQFGVANAEPCLHPTRKENTSFLQSESDLCALLVHLDRVAHMNLDPSRDAHRQDIAKKIHRDLQLVYTWKKDEWNRQRANVAETPVIETHGSGPVVVDTANYLKSHHHQYHPLVLSGLLLVLMLNLMFGLTRRGSRVVLAFVYGQMKLVSRFCGDAVGSQLCEHIPRTLESILSAFDLDPRTHQYISCPSCSNLHEYTDPLPSICSSPACNAKLLMMRKINGKSVAVPVRTYLHQSVKEWLGRFLSRPDIETFIQESQTRVPSDAGRVDDILSASFLQGFKGADGTQFLRHQEGEYRLFFALSADGFNPFSNKQSKQTATSTGIYLTCLNLPLSIRHQPKNMCLVGVVPGPKKPCLDAHLNLLAEDMLPLWNPGVRYTRTALKEDGVNCLGALVPVIADALGAREISGFTTITASKMCTFCELTSQELENMDKSTWKIRDPAEHRRLALQYLASGPKERKEILTTHGLRYTPLLKLPYFDPVKFTVVDTMHNLFLGLLNYHCRDIWGMNVELEDGDGSIRGSGALPTVPSPGAMQEARVALGRRDWTFVAGCGKNVLYYLCEENGLRRAGGVLDLLRELRQFASTVVSSNILNESIFPTPTAPDIQPPQRNAQPSPPTTTPSSSDAVPDISGLPALTVDLVSLIEAGDKTLLSGRAIGNLNKPILQYLSRLHSVLVPPGADKKVLTAAINGWRTQITRDGRKIVPINIDALLSKISPPEAAQMSSTLVSRDRKPNVAVLGRTVLQEVALDRANMELPSWINPAPVRAGQTSHGKLSADQWRTFCTINLTTTLIRLWGPEPEDSCHRQMLANFLDLVIAVEISSNLVTSQELIDAYTFHMTRYLVNMKSLYKDAKVVPNHHLALHEPDFLRYFGPAPGCHAFHVERFNYKVQQINTNQHFGEIEMTFMRTACREANLSYLLEKPDIQGTVEDLCKAYSEYLDEDQRGTRIRDHHHSQPELTPLAKSGSAAKQAKIISTALFESLAECLSQDGPHRYIPYNRNNPRQPGSRDVYPDYTFLSKLQISGVSYQPSATSAGSANILLRLDGDVRHQPAVIEQIFLHSYFDGKCDRKEAFVAVRYFLPLDSGDLHHDHYRQFPRLGASLWKAELAREICVLRTSLIICHIAKTTIKLPQVAYPCVVALALDCIRTQLEQHGNEMEECEGLSP